MKRFDAPPVWLASFLALAWIQSGQASLGLGFGGVWADFAGGLCVGGGLVLVAMAIVEFRRHQTPLHPHETATRLIQSGIFSKSRNPIYLGGVLILTGLILRWDAVLSLALVPIFVWVMEVRFIIPEENRLRRTFRKEFARYESKVRRWV